MELSPGHGRSASGSLMLCALIKVLTECLDWILEAQRTFKVLHFSRHRLNRKVFAKPDL